MFCIHRESFPNDLQFTILMRFTVDQTQTPNLKVNFVIVCACVHVCATYELRVCADVNKRHGAGGSGTVCLCYLPAHSPHLNSHRSQAVIGQRLDCFLLSALVVPFETSSSCCSSVLSSCTCLSLLLFPPSWIICSVFHTVHSLKCPVIYTTFPLIGCSFKRTLLSIIFHLSW